MLLQDEVIHRINQELNDLRELQGHQSHDHTHPTDVRSSHHDEVVQQLEFGNEEGNKRDEGEGVRLVQLATQVEDLNYQLSTVTDDLEVIQKRAEIAEVSIIFYTYIFTKFVQRRSSYGFSTLTDTRYKHILYMHQLDIDRTLFTHIQKSHTR